jgi:SH3 domain protein
MYLFPFPVNAETRYVSDKLVISVRSGPGKNASILKNISTGTAMTVLENKGEFIKVSVEGGLTGWVPKYYTETDVPKEQVIESLNLEMNRLQQETEKQASRLKELNEIDKENKQNHNKINTLTRQLSEVQDKYNSLLVQSEDIVETIRERDSLKEAAFSREQRLLELQKENQTLKNYKMIYWFATGGAIFLLGWLIGKLSRKSAKRSITL